MSETTENPIIEKIEQAAETLVSEVKHVAAEIAAAVEKEASVIEAELSPAPVAPVAEHWAPASESLAAH